MQILLFALVDFPSNLDTGPDGGPALCQTVWLACNHLVLYIGHMTAPLTSEWP